MFASEVRCTICRCQIDDEELFCSNCGTEAPVAKTDLTGQSVQIPKHQRSLHSFQCSGCGASMSYDASAQSLRCPFCGSTALEENRDSRTLRPTHVIPFVLDAQTSQNVLREWLSKGFWRPGKASSEATVNELTNVFVPFWVVSSQTRTDWTGDSSQPPRYSRSGWYPVTGEHQGSYSSVLVNASSILSQGEIQGVSPFDFRSAVPPDDVNLDHVIVEEFRMPRKYARPIARAMIEELERATCRRYVPGNSRNMHVNVQLSSLHSEPVLLPLWILVYRFRGRPYRVLINGQSGRIAGEAPFAYGKLIAILSIVLFVVVIVVAAVVFGNAR